MMSRFQRQQQLEEELCKFNPDPIETAELLAALTKNVEDPVVKELVKELMEMLEEMDE